MRQSLFHVIGDLLKVDRNTPLNWRTGLMALCLVTIFIGFVMSAALMLSIKDEAAFVPGIIGIGLLVGGLLALIPIVRSHRRAISEEELRDDIQQGPFTEPEYTHVPSPKSRVLGMILLVSGVALGIAVIIELTTRGSTFGKTPILAIGLIIAGIVEIVRTSNS